MDAALTALVKNYLMLLDEIYELVEQEAAEDQLEQAIKAKEQLLLTITKDINTNNTGDQLDEQNTETAAVWLSPPQAKDLE